jgi:hypothetical protein
MMGELAQNCHHPKCVRPNFPQTLSEIWQAVIPPMLSPPKMRTAKNCRLGHGDREPSKAGSNVSTRNAYGQ